MSHKQTTLTGTDKKAAVQRTVEFSLWFALFETILLYFDVPISVNGHHWRALVPACTFLLSCFWMELWPEIYYHGFGSLLRLTARLILHVVFSLPAVIAVYFLETPPFWKALFMISACYVDTRVYRLLLDIRFVFSTDTYVDVFQIRNQCKKYKHDFPYVLEARYLSAKRGLDPVQAHNLYMQYRLTLRSYFETVKRNGRFLQSELMDAIRAAYNN